MAKLYFRYGTVSSAKTLNLLAVFHNYGSQGKKAILVKPKRDDRFGASVVKSRAGLVMEADYVLPPTGLITQENPTNVECILVDEVQFFAPSFIEQLRKITLEHNIPAICYGLRTDFRTKLFEGSKRLMELADTIEEIKTTCSFCNKKSVYNLKQIDGVAVSDGPQIELGAEEKYLPTCGSCYAEKTQVKVKESTPKNTTTTTTTTTK